MSRRNYLQLSGSGFIFCCLLWAAACSSSSSPTPNIVVILVDDLGWRDLGFMGSKFYQTQLDFVWITLAEVLRNAGYVSASIGKWHLGKLPGYGPLKQGFDLNVAGNHKGHPPAGYFAPFELPGIEAAPEGQYLPDRITDEAVDFIQSHHSRPFFLYLSYYAVHTPLQAPEDVIDVYRNIEENARQGDPIYAAMVERLDFGIGRILEKLEALNLTENSLVIFLSDNGGNQRVTSMDPLRGGKGMLYEGGIRVPLVIRWPGKVGAGTSCDVPVICIDLFPTILEAVEVDPLSTQPADGVSLFPLLFREGELETSDLELYDLEMDRGEKLNLADKKPHKKQELLDLLKAWRFDIKAPVPREPNPEYKK